MARDPVLIPAIVLNEAVGRYRPMDGEACPEGTGFPSGMSGNDSMDGGAMV